MVSSRHAHEMLNAQPPDDMTLGRVWVTPERKVDLATIDHVGDVALVIADNS